MADLYELMESLRNAPQRHLLTVCGEADAAGTLRGAHGVLCARPEPLSEEAYAAIRAEADAWVFLVEHDEWYDYDAYANLGGDRSYTTERPFGDNYILVRDGAFYGVAIPARYGKKDPWYVCAADYAGEPLPLWSRDSEWDPNNIEEPHISTSYYLKPAKE